MIIIENITIGEEQYIKTHSDSGRMIRKVGTEEVYAEAIDVADAGFTYIETDMPVEPDREATAEDMKEMLKELGVVMDDEE